MIKKLNKREKIASGTQMSQCFILDVSRWNIFRYISVAECFQMREDETIHIKEYALEYTSLNYS